MKLGGNLLHERFQVCVLSLQVQTTSFCPCEFLKAAHQPPQAQDFLMNRAQILWTRRKNAVEEPLNMGLKIGKGSPQLMGQITGQLLAKPLLLFQRSGKVVECHRQLSNFIFSFGFHPLGEIAIREALGGTSQCMEGLGEAAGHAQPDNQGKTSRSDGNPPEPPIHGCLK